MAKPFDATLNSLIDLRPGAWADYLAARVGAAPGPSTVLDTDLSITAQADKVFRVAGPTPYLLHLELESNPRLGVPAGLLRYNVLLGHQHELPVHTVLMLLRPKADASDQTGEYEVIGATGSAYLRFRYTVVRVWERSVAELLAADVGLAPLAVLTDEAAADLPATFLRLRERLRADGLPASVIDETVGLTTVLGALRYKKPQLAGLRAMPVDWRESWVVQEWLAEGGVLGVQRTLLRQGGRRFGPAGEAASARLRAITDPDRLDRMADRVFDAAGWDDLLATE